MPQNVNNNNNNNNNNRNNRNNNNNNNVIIDDNENTEIQDFDDMKWDALGHHVRRYFQRTPTVNFMLGPLSMVATAPAKKERRRVEREKLAQKINPEEVSDQQVCKKIGTKGERGTRRKRRGDV